MKQKNTFFNFLERKNIIFSAKRYGIDALGAMAQGLFASLLIGTIIGTLGEQLGSQLLIDMGSYAKSVSGPAMAISIGYALCAARPLFPSGSRSCRKHAWRCRRSAGCAVRFHHRNRMR